MAAGSGADVKLINLSRSAHRHGLKSWIEVAKKRNRSEGIRVLCRGFGFKLSYDGKDDGMEFPAPQTLKWNQIVGTLVDDRVGMIGGLTLPIASYRKRTAEARKNID